MTRIEFLQHFKAFTEQAVGNLLLPVRQQKEDKEAPAARAADVYLMRLPDMTSTTKKAPYILHQLVTGSDKQKPGDKQPGATAVLRSVFCVYGGPDEQEGALMLLNLMERLRIALLEQPVIAQRYWIDLEAGIETMVYPDVGPPPNGTAPYYLGEMVTTWVLPFVKREDLRALWIDRTNE